MGICDNVTENASEFAERLASLDYVDKHTEDLPLNKLVVVILSSLLTLVILVGNGLIIASVCVVKKLRQPANYLIVSLAFSDFLVAFAVLPFTIVYDGLDDWVFGPTMCRIHVGFDVVCCATSILNLVMISIDRYLMVTRPLTYPKKRTAKLMVFMICCSWTLALLVVFPGFPGIATGEPDWITLGNGSARCGNGTSISREECYSSEYGWQYRYFVNLSQEYNVTKINVAFSSSANQNVSFRMQMISEKATQVDFQPLSSGVNEIAETPARYIRLQVEGAELEHLGNETFKIFGELTQGKPCLISQEKGFTVYSTVCSFFMPLTVMIVMYYNIFQEASRFKARHVARAKSLADQPNVIMSELLPRREWRSIALDDSAWDLLDYSEEIQQQNNSADPQIHSRNESVNSTILTQTRPQKLNHVTTSEDCAESCSLASSTASTSSAGRTAQASERRLQEELNAKACPYNIQATTLARGAETVGFEVNDNIPDGCKVQSARGTHWCETPQTSSMDSACKSNGRPGTAEKNATHRTDHLLPFAGGGRGLFLVRRKSRPSRSLQLEGSKSFQRKFSTSSHRERIRNAKAIRTLGIIVTAFTICWLPFSVLTVLRPFVCGEPGSGCCPVWLVRLVLWLGYLNSALNPFIYVGFSPDLRDTFRFLICCKCTNVDRRLAQRELRQAIEHERKYSTGFR